MIFILAGLVAGLAFFVQGFSGFGAALVMTPLLLLFLDLHPAVAAAAIVQAPIGIWLTYGARRTVAWRELIWLAPLSMIGLLAGTVALLTLDVVWLRRLCGILTACFALDLLRRMLRGGQSAHWPQWFAIPAGFAGGVLGGLFGTSGPPVVAYLERRLDRGAFLRGTLLAYFLITNLIRLFGYGVGGLFDRETAFVALAMLPGAAIGAGLGAWLQQKAGERNFRMVMALVLLTTGLGLLR
ncbi:MAG: sulfite exporter TauE/SafE family protein [Oscillochloris sp.]|nr:sulfite exporter TauE/SafE family protein [Oscillochloris sp.]